jgi:hypothetical protein
VKEQSHKNEMSAALRGDFKRLRERGVTTTLSPGETETETETEESEVEAVAPSPAVAAAVEVETVAERELESPPGWLGRLLGR